MLTLVNRVTRCEFVVTVRLDIDDLRGVRVAKGFCHGKNAVEGGSNGPFMETGFIGGWSCFNGSDSHASSQSKRDITHE